jgi:hypothetical protein
MWIGMLEMSPLASARVLPRAASAIVDTSPRSRARIASSAALKGFISAAFMLCIRLELSSAAEPFQALRAASRRAP